jgi:hypothetical protein
VATLGNDHARYYYTLFIIGNCAFYTFPFSEDLTPSQVPIPEATWYVEQSGAPICVWRVDVSVNILYLLFVMFSPWPLNPPSEDEMVFVQGNPLGHRLYHGDSGGILLLK